MPFGIGAPLLGQAELSIDQRSAAAASTRPVRRWQRQYSGTAGRVENCQLGVFLAYASSVYVVQAGCSWWKLPAAMFGISRATAHRRFAEWTEARCGNGCTRKP